jgi:Arc/MetJ-type ribon-helix-helix transcriptional regulator
MKTAQLPPVRVAPAVRAEIESALHEGESLSEFVEASVLQAARHRKAQQAFLARGRSSLARARKSGEFHALQGVMDGMQARLEDRMRALSKPADKSATQSTSRRTKATAADKR